MLPLPHKARLKEKKMEQFPQGPHSRYKTNIFAVFQHTPCITTVAKRNKKIATFCSLLDLP